MIDLKTVNRIYISPGYTNLTVHVDGLISLVKSKLNKDPFDGSLFIFCNKARDKIKILHFEYNGFWLYYKRFETGKLKWPLSEVDQCITEKDLHMLLNGMIILQKAMPECTARIT